MTRFENHVHHRELYEMGREFVLQFIRSYKKAPVKIILDFDDSNSNTYGVQEQTLFNDYYGEYCYMPLFIFEVSAENSCNLCCVQIVSTSD